MEKANVIKLKDFNYSDEQFKLFEYGLHETVDLSKYPSLDKVSEQVREAVNNFTLKIKAIHKKNSENVLQKNRLKMAKLAINFDNRSDANPMGAETKQVSLKIYGLCSQYFNSEIAENIRKILTNTIYNKIVSEVDIFPGRLIYVSVDFEHTDWTVPSPVLDDDKFYNQQYERIYCMKCNDFTKDPVVEKEPTVITDADIATD